jgi:hypothetical protein
MADTLPSVGSTYRHNTNGTTVIPFSNDRGRVRYSPTVNQGPEFPMGREFSLTQEEFLSTFTRTNLSSVPVNSVAPAITGVPKVGVVLSTDGGTWTGTPTPSLTYQWKKSGAAISGATKDFYVPVVGDVGAPITVTVTGTNSGGTVSGTSSATANVAA